MEHAKQLLQETDLPMIEVAYRSGYHSLNRFEFNFSKISGMSATEYRERHRN